VIFKIYLIGLEHYDVINWGNELKDNVPSKEFHQNTCIGNLCFYCVIMAVFLAGHFKIPRMLEWICSLFVVNICVTSYLVQPFNPDHPREFVNWALILLFRCAVICLLFQINGCWDVAFATLSPLVIIIAGGFKLGATEDLPWMLAWILLTFVCMFILNYMIARDYKVLFLLEKQGLENNDSIMNIINLFNGAVIIVNDKSHQILFQNDQLEINNYIL
jgi:hypothetical protein